METHQKKRDKKANFKAHSHGTKNFKQGTIDFGSGDLSVTKGPKFNKDKSKSHDKGKSFDKSKGGKPNGKSFSKGKDNKVKYAGKMGDKRPFKGGDADDKKGASHSQMRRQKQKVGELIKKLRINYNKLLMKKKDLGTGEQKSELVKESMEVIGDKYKDLIYKHDGCRIIQALVKHGNSKQKEIVINHIKDFMIEMMTGKYSYHLAQKAFYYAPTAELKAQLRLEINSQISKLIMHQYASEVIEYMYSQTEQEKHRREMVYAFYGQYFLLLKEQAAATEDHNVSLAAFLKAKPQLKDKVLEKIERIVQKLVEKGLSRHSLVQAIICDYIQAQDDLEKLKWLADTMKEKLPTLLASKQGLFVACAFFNLLEAKDRKTVLKSIQEPLKEMLTNKVAHLFVLHVLNSLDDTVLAKKKVLQDILVAVDDLVSDKCYQNVLLGIYCPKSRRFFGDEDLKAFEALQEHTTSKKDPAVRREELIRIIQAPLEKFYEESMPLYLSDIYNNPLFSQVLLGRAEIGGESDACDEFLRQIQKKEKYEGEKSQVMLGHPAIHRVVKDMVLIEAKDSSSEKTFCKTLAGIMEKHMEDCLKTRAVFILIAYMENPTIRPLMEDKISKKTVNALLKEKGKMKGLEILAKKL